MDVLTLQGLLEDVATGRIAPSAALDALRDFPVAEAARASLDTHRALRTGFPEVVLCEGKSRADLVDIVAKLRGLGEPVLVTRIPPEDIDALVASLGSVSAPFERHDLARAALFGSRPVVPEGRGDVCVVSAGTADAPIAAEAALVAELCGSRVCRIHDVGISGLHRLTAHADTLRRAAVIVAVAGMEGALPGVIAGLFGRPVIAVPTSRGYGVGAGGFAALAGMLTSCAAGVLVVNIDNGFGAGYAAGLINRAPSATGCQ